MYEKGYTLTDIVFIEKKGLSKEEAFKEELTLIKDTKPIFNQLSNPDHWFGSRNCTKEQALFAKILHEMGYGYQRIAYLLGASKPIGAHMTIKRMITYV